MQSLETKSVRPKSFETRPETIRDRDSKKRVSRPRPSLKIPSLEFGLDIGVSNFSFSDVDWLWS